MQQSKLFTLLSGLEAAEFRWLHKFLKSPFYNTNEKVLNLFLYIKKYYPDLTSPKLAKEITFQYLFPKQQFQAQKMRKLMHELATLVEDFMVAQHFQKNQFARKKILTQELGQRNLYGLFEKGSTEIAEDLDKLPYRDKDYFLEKYEITYRFLSHPLTPKQHDVRERLLPLSDNLDHFYFLQKLKLNCDLESAKNIYATKNGLPFFEEIEREIGRRTFNNRPIISLYSLISRLFKEDNSIPLFNKSYQQFLIFKNEFSAEDKEIILKYLINHTIRQFNKGHKEFIRIAFELYKTGLSDVILLKANRITATTFTNIVSVSCQLKEFDFAKEFIEQYQFFIDPKKRVAIVLLNKADLQFKSGNYSTAIDLLLSETFSHHLYKLKARTLLIKAYYELFLVDESYYNLLKTQLDNFERYLRREEDISESKKLRFFNFSRFLKKLINSKLKKLNLENAKKDLASTTIIANKFWLLDKV